MSQVWCHLTHPDGMTVSLLVKATGLTKDQVRAELRALEQDGKLYRERAPIGKEHLWWRFGSRPLSDLDALLVMGLAARFPPHTESAARRAAASQYQVGKPGSSSDRPAFRHRQQPARDCLGRREPLRVATATRATQPTARTRITTCSALAGIERYYLCTQKRNCRSAKP